MIGLAEPMEFYKTFLEWYVDQVKAKSYLEIGCADGGLVYRLLAKCSSLDRAVGVDISNASRNNSPKASFFSLSSNEYFSIHTDTFDVILIDGDHSAAQAYRDALSSLDCLSSDGLMLMHDTYPPDADHTQAYACGDAWRVPDNLIHNRSLEVFTFPVTFGLTLVRKVGVRPWL